MIDLKGKNALVTGGSAGIGASISTQLAQEGVNLVINYAHSKERAEKLAKELSEKYKIKAFAVQFDIFDTANLYKLVDQTVELLGGIDILISNAGYTKIIPYSDLESLDIELWDKTFSANVKAHFFLFKAAKTYFDKNKQGGCFITTSSIAGRKVAGSSMPYSVSKAALIQLTKFLAKTQSNNKIRIHTVAPGLVLTPDWGANFPQKTIDKMTNDSPIKQTTDVDEVASQFVYLCKLSTSTGTVTGHDAGLHL
ncbi:unnamed protein product [Candida verbasci]|uniref:Uncharacterized protein n=1 Tax=Candida verbasci TaxID=1227364 RepID=A0A9W4XCJ8_9ASCO|nr:unnamed protein product [Candida verbasci]